MRDNKFWNLFKQEQNKITYKTTSGKFCEFKTSSLKIPQLVSRLWVTKLIGEKPNIKIGEKEVNKLFGQNILERIDLPVNQLVSMGRTIVIPYMKKNGKLSYELINEFEDNVEMVAVDDEIVYLKYSLNETVIYNSEAINKKVTYLHQMVDNIYTQKRYFNHNNMTIYIDGLDGTQKLANDFMFPFFIDLTINFDKVGYPIWSNAFYQVKDVDKSYTEMKLAEERLRPVVGIPRSLVETERGTDDISSIDGISGMFALIPGLDSQEWKYFGGTFDPEPYAKTIDFILNNISQQSGLGHRTLSYDRTTGVAKTATEVVFSNNESMINQSLVNQTVELLIKRLVKSYYYMVNSKWLEDNDIVIEFEDAIFNSKEEYVNQLRYDMEMGNISQDFYLEELYPSENLDKIKGTGQGA